jgi:hypothetical protein
LEIGLASLSPKLKGFPYLGMGLPELLGTTAQGTRLEVASSRRRRTGAGETAG